jgi:hypothetical protein
MGAEGDLEVVMVELNHLLLVGPHCNRLFHRDQRPLFIIVQKTIAWHGAI